MRARTQRCWLLLALLASGAASSVALADDARQWLARMNQALTTRNYDGVFFHMHGGRVETMRIIHRVKDGSVTERLVSLDGSGREFVRTGTELVCYLPDKRTVLVERRPQETTLLGNLPRFDESTEGFYELREVERTRLMGRETRVISVLPKDGFATRLCDEATTMPLEDPALRCARQRHRADPVHEPSRRGHRRCGVRPQVDTEVFKWLRRNTSARDPEGATIVRAAPAAGLSPDCAPRRRCRPDGRSNTSVGWCRIGVGVRRVFRRCRESDEWRARRFIVGVLDREAIRSPPSARCRRRRPCASSRTRCGPTNRAAGRVTPPPSLRSARHGADQPNRAGARNAVACSWACAKRCTRRSSRCDRARPAAARDRRHRSDRTCNAMASNSRGTDRSSSVSAGWLRGAAHGARQRRALAARCHARLHAPDRNFSIIAHVDQRKIDARRPADPTLVATCRTVKCRTVLDR